MWKSRPVSPTQPKQYEQLVSAIERTRYELFEQFSQSMQCWQLLKPREPRQCKLSEHCTQRTQKLQRIKLSESLQNVQESQATQRSQATQDSFSRSRPMPATSFRNRVSKVRALNFVSLGMAAVATIQVRSTRRSSAARTRVSASSAPSSRRFRRCSKTGNLIGGCWSSREVSTAKAEHTSASSLCSSSFSWTSCSSGN